MSDSDTADDSERLADTTERLRKAIGSRDDANGGTDANEGSERDESDGIGADLAEAAELVTRAETDLEDLFGILLGDREGTLEDAQDDLDDLIEVIDEAEDLLSTVDLSALPGAVDWSAVPDAIEAGDVPDAIEAGDADEAVDFRKLLQIVDLREVLDNVDLRSLWQQKDEFDEATDDLTDDDGDDEDDGSILDRFRDDSDDGLFDRFGTDDDSSDDAGSDVVGGDGDVGDDEEEVPSEVIQAKVQSRLREAIDEFRESALEARDRLKEMRDRSKEKFEEKTGETGQPSSRNPTAYSTLPDSESRVDIGTTTGFSTIPQTPRHSSAPGRDRIYGDRFENRNQENDDE